VIETENPKAGPALLKGPTGTAETERSSTGLEQGQWQAFGAFFASLSPEARAQLLQEQKEEADEIWSIETQGNGNSRVVQIPRVHKTRVTLYTCTTGTTV
jgi:hypothetical protein